MKLIPTLLHSIAGDSVGAYVLLDCGVLCSSAEDVLHKTNNVLAPYWVVKIKGGVRMEST